MVGDDTAAFGIVEAAAEPSRIRVRIADDVPAIDPPEHRHGDDDRDEAEDPLQRRFSDHLGGDASEQPTRHRGDLEKHPEAQVHELIPGAGGRHCARRRNHGCQADCRRRLERKSEAEGQEGHEQNAAPEPEGNAKAAGDRAGGKDDQGQRDGEGRHAAATVCDSARSRARTS